MKRIIVAFVFIAFSAIANAQTKPWQQEPEAVLGVKLGQPLDSSALPRCPEKSYEATAPCLVTASVKSADGRPIYSVAGHPFTYAAVSIKIDGTGVVSRLQTWMKHERFAEFKHALVARYGPPTTQTNEMIQSVAGATYPNQTSKWVGQNVTIIAMERFEKIDESMVIFSHNAAAERDRVEREIRTKGAASKL